MQAKCYEFPLFVPKPGNSPYTPPLAPIILPYNPPPTPAVITYPGLFNPQRSEFHPVPDVCLVSQDDQYFLQAVYAAQQFIVRRCREQGLPGAPEPNPLVAESNGTIAGLYSELSLLSTMFGVVQFEILLGPRREAAHTAFTNFQTDMMAYAPWLRFAGGVPDINALVAEGHAKLRELQDLIKTYRQARLHFQGMQQMDTTYPPERERGGQW
jgi:hypothetical protein